MLPIHMKEEEDDTPQEWSLLELNGELITPDKVAEGDAMELGSVKFDAEGTPIMTIASHELKGKVQALQQPLVIMKPRSKRTNVESSSASNESNKRMKVGTDKMDVDKMDEQHDGYEVAGVVTSKILFDRYPKSIMR